VRVQRVLATAADRRIRSAHRERNLLRAAGSEASNTHGLDVHIVGAGNSAGQAALFFSPHARSVTILYRGDTLEKGM
jgi:thioredoxin reductase